MITQALDIFCERPVTVFLYCHQSWLLAFRINRLAGDLSILFDHIDNATAD
jgi:hypothetical protein